MILKVDLKNILDNLSEKDILKCYESGKPYIKISQHHFNPGGFTSIEGVDFDEDDMNETLNDGDFYGDADDLRVLVEETETTNQTLLTYYS